MLRVGMDDLPDRELSPAKRQTLSAKPRARIDDLSDRKRETGIYTLFFLPKLKGLTNS